jgi:hypothetical protein
LTQEEVIYVFYVEEGYIPPWDKYQYQVRGKKFQSGVWDHLIIGFSVYNGYGADISDKSQIIDVHMDNSGELHMVAAFAYDASDKETGAIKYYFSGDGGLNWDTTRPNIEYFIGPPRSDQHYRHFRYPNIDCSLGGRLQVSFSFDSDPPEIGGWGGNTHIRASYSDDGNSWTTTGIGNTVGVARYNVLATDSLGYVYVAWHNYISGGGTYSFGIVWNRNPNNGDESSWMGQETLVDPASVDQLFPELVVDDKDTLNLIWSDNRDDNREIYMRRSHDNGDHWTRDLRLTFADESSYIPSAAVGSNRILHIVWQDYRDSAYEIYYRFLVDERRLSHDWEHSITPKTVVDLDGDTHIVWRERIGGGLEDWEIIYEKLDDEGNVLIKKAMTDDALDQYSPALAVGRNPGPVHLSIVYVEEKGTNDEFWHVGSTDGGITWTYTFITYLEVDDDGAGIDVAISQSGRIHAVLTDYMEAAGIAYERLEYYWSDDNGLSWLSDTLVYESYPAMGVEHFGMITYPNIATGGHPYVHITYAYDPSPAPFSDPSQPGLATSIEYLRSLHDGGYVWNWLYGDPIATTNEIGRYHSLVADLNGHVYVAWHDKDTLGGIPYCVFFARNWLNGASGFWNTGILADDLTRDQYTPDIAVDAIGNPHAVWSEERNGADELFHRTSFDLGVQWDIPKRLTISSGDSYNPSIYADNEGTLHITWQDTRGQYAQVYYRTL